MPISEAILIDNLQYMAMMPDKRFSIGVPDPNYGLKESLRKAQSRQNLSKTKVNSEFDWDNAIPPPVYFSELKRVPGVYKKIDELGIDPQKALDLKTDILRLYLSQYEKGAQLAISIIKELPTNGPF